MYNLVNIRKEIIKIRFNKNRKLAKYKIELYLDFR